MNTSFSSGKAGSRMRELRHVEKPVTDETEGGVIDLTALLRTLWRGRLLILATTLAGMLMGGYYAYAVATPIYTSEVVVMLNNRDQQVVNLDSVVGGLGRDLPVVNTEVQVLRSRDLLGKVVDRMDLMSDPEFNGRLAPPSSVVRAKTAVKSILGLLPVPTVREGGEDDRLARQSVIDSLRRAVAVQNIPDSLVFQVTVRSEDADKAALLADTLVELYIENQLEVKFEATEQAASWLSNRVSELQTGLEAAESRAQEFSTGIDLVSPEGLEAAERQLKGLRDRTADTRNRLDTAKARLSGIESANAPQEQLAATNDGQLRNLLPQIDEPGVAARFAQRVDFLAQQARQETARLQSQLDVLSGSLAEFEARVQQQNADLITLQQFTREAEASRLLYEHFLARLKETSAQQGIQQADSRVLSGAVIPTVPSEPRKSFLTLVSALFGFVVGAGVMLVREALSDSFRNTRALEGATGYAVIGEIPRIPLRKRKGVLAYFSEKPTSAAAEAVRNLRTSVLLSNIDQPPQVIMVSSSIPGEGKTTVSLSLAHNLADMGRRVLLIEGDVRRRVMSSYFDLTVPRQGMISVLTNDRSLADTIVSVPGAGVDVLFGEETRANAADIFASERFAELIAEVRQHYDHVIIDTPPVMVVPDARIIAQHADARVFVVRWDSTARGLVSEALAMFESVNAPVSGLVLNNIDQRGQKGYGYGHGYGRYGRGYYTS